VNGEFACFFALYLDFYCFSIAVEPGFRAGYVEGVTEFFHFVLFLLWLFGFLDSEEALMVALQALRVVIPRTACFVEGAGGAASPVIHRWRGYAGAEQFVGLGNQGERLLSEGLIEGDPFTAFG
jgi:hypothetical protein